MKTAEEILEKYWNKQNYMQAYFLDQKVAILNAIDEARKEAIEECAKVAAFESKDLEKAILEKIKELK